MHHSMLRRRLVGVLAAATTVVAGAVTLSPATAAPAAPAPAAPAPAASAPAVPAPDVRPFVSGAQTTAVYDYTTRSASGWLSRYRSTPTPTASATG
jgi:hypothetical protein